MSDSPDWTAKPPALENPKEAAEAQEILAREHSVPRGHEDLSEIKSIHKEEVNPSPKNLDSDHAWYFPACAYCMIGMDRSLFELYSWYKHAAVPVLTHRAEKPIAELEGVDISKNPWFYTVQGIDQNDARAFKEYIESYEFNDRKNNLQWRLHIQPMRTTDPFMDSDVRVGVPMYLMLPECLTTRRRVMVTREPGLALNPLRLGVRQLPKGS